MCVLNSINYEYKYFCNDVFLFSVRHKTNSHLSETYYEIHETLDS